MNVYRSIGKLCGYANVLSQAIPPQMAQKNCWSRLPRCSLLRSLQMSRTVPLNLRRHLQIKAGKKNLFSGRHKMDRVPAEFSVVYNSTLGLWFTFFRVGTGTIFATIAGVIYLIRDEISKEFFESARGIFITTCSIFFVIFTVSFSVLARRFFSRIYYHAESGNFIGIKRDLFGRLKQLKYNVDDVKHTGLSTKNKQDGWESSLVDIKGRKMQIHSQHFISPSFYNMHLGGAAMESELVREPRF